MREDKNVAHETSGPDREHLGGIVSVKEFVELLYLHWWDAYKGIKCDGGELPPQNPVQVYSQHHLIPPLGYDFFEEVPRFLQVVRGPERIQVGHEDATTENALESSSVYWSDEFALFAPRHPERESWFTIRFAADSHLTDEIWAGMLRSSSLSIQYKHVRRRIGIEVGLKAVLHGTTVQVGAAEAGRGSEVVYTATPTVDPTVSFSLLQGAELRDHLLDVARAYAADTGDDWLVGFAILLNDLGAPYFERPIIPEELEPEPIDLDVAGSVDIEIGIPEDETPGAVAVVATDLNSGERTVSDPLFLRQTEGYLVASNLPYEWLVEPDRSLLTQLAFTGSTFELAHRLGEPPTVLWLAATRVAEKLGVPDVGDALRLARLLGFGRTAVAVR